MKDIVIKQKQPSLLYEVIDDMFLLTKRGTNIKTEFYAGALMFFEVICMSAVCAQLIASQAGIASFSTVYFAMILMTVCGTILTGLVCNAPVIQSMSMATVVLIVSTMSTYLGMTLSNVLFIAMVSNAIYLVVMAVPPLRKFVSNAVPKQIKKALPAALGAYLLVYVLTQLNVFGITTNNYNTVLEGMAAAGEALPYWGVNTYSFTAENAAFGGWYAQEAIITAMVGFTAMTVLHAKKFKHATILSFGITLVVFVAMWLIRGNFMDYYFYAFITPSYGSMYFYDSIQRIFGEFEATMFLKPITEGMDFSKYVTYLTYLESQATGLPMDQVTVDATGSIVMAVVTTALSFLTLGVSETAAGIHGSAFAAKAYDEDGNVVYMEHPGLGIVGKILNLHAMTALVSTIGCALGMGPVTIRPETAVGGKEGGKTGLAALVAGALSIVALFNLVFSALFLNGIVVFGILLFVALSLLESFRDCDFTDSISAIPFIATVAAAAVTQNLVNGILLGVALDTVVKLLGGKAKQIHPGAWVFTLVFLVTLALHFI